MPVIHPTAEERANTKWAAGEEVKTGRCPSCGRQRGKYVIDTRMDLGGGWVKIVPRFHACIC